MAHTAKADAFMSASFHALIKMLALRTFIKYASRELYHVKARKTLNAAVNGKLELTLLKGRQRFDTVSTSNLKV